jgi:hypothetical protein
MELKIIKTLGEGEMLPRWYGVAWQSSWWEGKPKVVCLPVPMNVLARVARDAFIYLSTFGVDIPASPRSAYLKGYAEGVGAGIDKGEKRATEDADREAFRAWSAK